MSIKLFTFFTLNISQVCQFYINKGGEKRMGVINRRPSWIYKLEILGVRKAVETVGANERESNKAFISALRNSSI